MTDSESVIAYNVPMKTEMNMTCMAKLIGKNVDRDGTIWLKEWALMDGDREFGNMIWNKRSTDKPFTIMFYSPLGKDFGVTGTKTFTDVDEALAYAKENKDCNKTYTMAMVEDRLAKLKEYRRQEEMSDDYFYSNGKGRMYDERQNQLLRLKSALEAQVVGE